MTGLLVPLVLAAVLSVVAVAAAGRGPALVAGPPAIASPPRQSAGVLLSGRRLAGAGIVAAVVVGLVALVGQGERHPGGDPGGRMLADLKSATAAIPAGARVLSRQENEPSWISCGGAPGSGWTGLDASVQFSVSLPPSQLIDNLDRQLNGRGWRLVDASVPRATWTKDLTGGIQAHAELDSTGRSGVWWLRLSAPPQGPNNVGNC